MLKRLLDITLSALALIILSPLMFLLCLVTWKKPFFRQKRYGKGMRLFTCYKFRTMHLDAEKKLDELLKKAEYRNQWQHFHKLNNDPRITKIGSIMRKYSLDELPQFFNVLRGDLSLVGPRAFAEIIDDPLFLEKIPVITRVRPGITGLWQTSGRSSLTLHERLHLEERYALSHSTKEDIKILFKTLPVVLSTKGAV